MNPEPDAYLKRSSNACRALEGPDDEDFVSRSTVVRGSKSGHWFCASLGDTRAGIGFWHSNGALVSKFAHCAQLWRADPQRAQVPSVLHAVAAVSSCPQREQRITSLKPGMLKVFGAMGGWPRGAYSFFGGAPCSRRGWRGSSW